MSSRQPGLKRTLQFSVAGLLLLALWFAGLAAGYRRGFNSGYVDGQRKRESEEPYFVKYSLYEKLPVDYDPMDPDYAVFEPIVNKLYQNADPDSWLVYNKKSVHQKIVELLAATPNKRNLNQPSPKTPAGYGKEAYEASGQDGGR